MASLYLVFEQDYSQLHIVSDTDLSNDGPVSLYHNNVLLGTFANPSSGGTFSKSFVTNYVNTTLGARYAFTILPTDIDETSFSDGVWHIFVEGLNDKTGAVKFECLWCALAKMLKGDCSNESNTSIVNKIKAYMTVAEGATRVENFLKAKTLYNIAVAYADPYQCNCS